MLLNSIYPFIIGIELTLREDDEMEDIEDEIFNRKDTRKRKDKKRNHKQTRDMAECTKESFKKMKERKIDEQSRNSIHHETGPEYALQFSKDTYLEKGFIESAKWIKDVVAKNMLEKMNEEQSKKRFEVLLTSKKSSTFLGIRTCARYNRGEQCNFGKWHSTHKPQPEGQQLNHEDTYLAHRQRKMLHTEETPTSIHERLGRRNEMRLHSCTLCMEVFGSANGHSVLRCPWILKKNWTYEDS